MRHGAGCMRIDRLIDLCAAAAIRCHRSYQLQQPFGLCKFVVGLSCWVLFSGLLVVILSEANINELWYGLAILLWFTGGVMLIWAFLVSHGPRRFHWLLAGRCWCCGYDLRGSPGCCPECGWERV
jgi:hypothetical protein